MNTMTTTGKIKVAPFPTITEAEFIAKERATWGDSEVERAYEHGLEPTCINGKWTWVKTHVARKA